MLNLLLTVLGLGTLLILLAYVGYQIYRLYSITDLQRIKIFTMGITIAGLFLDAALATVKPSLLHLILAACFIFLCSLIMYKVTLLERAIRCASCEER